MDGGCLPVVTACTRVKDNNNRDIILIYNQALYNNDLAQHESLLHTHQANAHGVKINELPPWHSDIHGNPGLLSMQIEDISVPLSFDGRKTYIPIFEPSDSEIKELPQYELTSSLPWQPEQAILETRHNHRNILSKKVVDLQWWKPFTWVAT